MEFFKGWKIKVIVGLVAVLLGAMLYSASKDGVENIPQNLINMITVPFQKGATSIANSVTDFFDTYMESGKNYQDNQELKAQVNQLRQQLTDYETVKQENEQLKQIAGIKEQNPDISYTPATIISRDPDDRYGSFIIDKGTVDGLNLNDPVISSDGMVGIISEISPINARVKTILSPDVNIGVYEIRNKELGVVSGDTLLSQDGLCKLSILSKETLMTKGDLVVTSGASGIYPRGITVGTVKDIIPEAHGVTLYAELLPVSEIEALKNIYVITDFLGKGSTLEGFETGE